MSNPTFELVSPLSPEQCAARLSALIDIPPDGYDHLWNGSGNASILGNIEEDNFSLSVQQRGRSSSSLTSLIGTLRPKADGTMISGQCVFDPEFRKVMWGAAACAVFIGIPIVILLMGEYRSGAIRNLADLFGRDHQAETMGLAFLAAFNAVYPMFRLASKEYGDVLINFLMRTLEAHPIPRVAK